jgi:hypothetical protein
MYRKVVIYNDYIEKRRAHSVQAASQTFNTRQSKKRSRFRLGAGQTPQEEALILACNL